MSLFSPKEPTIYLSNYASLRSLPAERLYCIMVRPTTWMVYNRNVSVLAPTLRDFICFRAHKISIEEYQQRYLEEVSKHDLSPGNLHANDGTPVPSEAALFCTCSLEVARHNRCHRVWAAQYLMECGWQVVLDGQVI